MGNFKRGGKRFSGRDGGTSNMHKATCSQCGVSCEVPFRPTGERPVFCSNCFKNQGNGGGRPNQFGDQRRERSNFRDKQRYNVVCAKCGKACQVPFKPTAGKPVFCNDCFKQDGSGSKDSGEIMEQINLLNAKIDKLMKILTPEASTEKTKKPKVKKVKTKVKVAAKKASAK